MWNNEGDILPAASDSDDPHWHTVCNRVRREAMFAGIRFTETILDAANHTVEPRHRDDVGEQPRFFVSIGASTQLNFHLLFQLIL